VVIADALADLVAVREADRPGDSDVVGVIVCVAAAERETGGDSEAVFVLDEGAPSDSDAVFDGEALKVSVVLEEFCATTARKNSAIKIADKRALVMARKATAEPGV
jgi:hypothetical protein